MHLPALDLNNVSVSVIIPAYNSSKFLAAAIASVLHQSVPAIEIIVVDDGSTDDTKAVCDRYPAVKYIYQTNQGVATARNTGIDVSQGNCLVFLDSDDCLLPEAIEIGIDCLKANPTAGFVFGSYLFKVINPDGTYTTQKLFEDPPPVASYQTILAGQHKIQCATALFRREVIDADWFDPRYSKMEDLRLFLRVARQFPIYFHDRVVSEYRYHGENVSSQSAKMLIGNLDVHGLEWDYVRQTGKQADLDAYECGRATWIKFFGDRLPYEIMRCLQANNPIAAVGNLRLLLNYDPHLQLIDRAVYTSAELAVRNHLGTMFPASAAYWQQQFSHLPELLALPTDRPRLAQSNRRGGSTSFALDPTLTTALNHLSQQQAVPLATLLLAGFKTLLYRYTGNTDIVVGMPTVSQFDADIFVNAVALRSNLASNPPFQTLLHQVQQVATSAQPHQSYPIELIEGLQLQVTFRFDEDAPGDRIEESSLTGIPWTTEPRIAKFDLRLCCSYTSQGLGGQWVYDADLFDSATIDRLSGHFQNLLSAIVTDPHQPIGELPLLTALERSQLLPRDLGRAEIDRSIDRLFEAQVERTPNAIAVVFADQKLTYRELNSRANQLAHHLQKLGIRANELVGICLERSLETIVGILGILKAGGAYVPLDPSNPQDRLAATIADAQIEILVTESILLTNLPNCDSPRERLCQRVICLDSDLAIVADYPTTNLAHSGQLDRLAYVIYTSGSTGQPKGVLVNHANVVRLFTATESWYGFGDRDVWTLFHSFAFDFSVWEIWGALLSGGRLVVVPYFVSRDPTAFYRLLVSEQVTVLNQTPSAFYQLSKVDERLHLSEKLSLRLIIFGGEALNLPSLEPWFDRHGDTLPQLVNMYGITETTVHVTYRPLTRADTQATGSSIGRPIPDLQVYVLDAYLQPVPVGVSGEMYVGGAGVAQGYWQRAELTQQRFIPHPFSADPTARLYKTGDLARYLPDGDLEYLGRIDTQVKIRGFRIELGEIEAALNQHPAIDSSTVIVQGDLSDDRQLAAYLVAPTALHTPIQLREFLAAKLPTYMIPAMFAIVPAIPLTVNGKVDRQALLSHKIDVRVVSDRPNLEANPQPSLSANSTTTNGSKDRITEILIAIWSAVLGRSAIGIDENFFELGGHSISILQVAAGIQQRLGGTEIPVVKLFQYPTIARLAAYLNGVQPSQKLNGQLKHRAQQQRAAIDARRRR